MPVFYGPFREIIYRSVDYENQEAGLESKYQDLPYGQRVYVGPTRSSVTKPIQRPIQRLGAPLAAPPTRTAKRVPLGAPAAQRSESSSFPPPRRDKKKSECPKGHYWSYKHKKCMKSKF